MIQGTRGDRSEHSFQLIGKTEARESSLAPNLRLKFPTMIKAGRTEAL
jgi:hypothetical protein